MNAEKWAAAGELLTGAGTIALAVCAVEGLNTYVDNLRSKTRFNVAKGLVRRVLRVRDATQALRGLAQKSDYVNRPGRTPGDDFSIDDYEYAFTKRNGRLNDAFASLDAAIVEAEYLLEDKGLVRAKDEILKMIWDLHAAFRNHLAFERDAKRGVQHSAVMIDQDKESAAVLFDAPTHKGPDAFASELCRRVDAFVLLVKPHLGLRRRWWHRSSRA